jgi:hypothetical protein
MIESSVHHLDLHVHWLVSFLPSTVDELKAKSPCVSGGYDFHVAKGRNHYLLWSIALNGSPREPICMDDGSYVTSSLFTNTRKSRISLVGLNQQTSSMEDATSLSAAEKKAPIHVSINCN